jgi:hypothetical protein
MLAATKVLRANDEANGPVRSREIESVGAILDRTTEATIAEWYRFVQMDSLFSFRW